MPTESCPICKHKLPREFLSTHMTRAHPETPMPSSSEAEDSPAAPPSGAYQGDLAGGLAPPDSLTATLPESVASEVPPAPEPAAEEEVEAAAESDAPTEEAPLEEAAPPSMPAAEGEAEVDSESVPAQPVPEVAEAAAPAPPPSGTAVAAAPAPAAASPQAPPMSEPTPSTKDLHGWLRSHQRRTDRALERAEGWCDDFTASRRRR